MADNTINVKIREAYDTETNWNQNNPVLLQGQIAISSDKHGMYKVGDGTKTWSQLNYASHPASDVYAWAKAQTKPSYSASEITGSVTGVKGSSETSYRTGNVNITKANIGLENVENKSSATIRGEITQSNVTTALGFTPASNSVVTQSANGLMSSQDKILLDQLSDIVTLPRVAYSTLPSGNSGHETYFREWLEYISANYWSLISNCKAIIAPVHPNIRGWVVGYVYGTNDSGSVDSTTKIPKHCHFVFYSGYQVTRAEFGSYDGVYFYKEIQNQNGANVFNVIKTGDTMTGALTLYREGTTTQDYPAQLKFSVKDTTNSLTYTGAQISVYSDHTTGSATYGSNMVVTSGGNMFLGSGEAPASHYALYKGNTSENTYISADGSVYLQSNANTIGDRVGFRINNHPSINLIRLSNKKI